ncbi:hypothetical protein Q7453_12060 [Glaesserella parasuis]|nr:hypothetical protein [Glaesserella parasuis]MDO9896788.1 hypothetical protein [Glaesserella parasuis]
MAEILPMLAYEISAITDCVGHSSYAVSDGLYGERLKRSVVYADGFGHSFSPISGLFSGFADVAVTVVV